MKYSVIKNYGASFCFLLLASCQSVPLKDFESLQTGMDKNQVLNRMGSPSTSTRFKGMDRWIYKIYDNDLRYIREVHFLDDKAVYVGEEHQPEESRKAEVIDEKNQAEEIVIAEREVQHKKDLEKSYQDYQKKAKLQDGVKYMPKFVPIK